MLTVLLVLIAVVLAVLVGTRFRRMEERLRTLEARPLPVLESERVTEPNPLHGLRLDLHIAQDHPHIPFVALLRDALLREGAILEEGGLSINGIVVCNGYADVYYRADLTVQEGGEPLFALAERPPHGDRPGNLALELVNRLKAELRKRERQNALREL